MKLVAVTSSFSDVGCSKHHKALRPAFGGETVQGNVNLIIMIQNMKMNRIRPAHFGHHLDKYLYFWNHDKYKIFTTHPINKKCI